MHTFTLSSITYVGGLVSGHTFTMAAVASTPAAGTNDGAGIGIGLGLGFDERD
jgi:hypothetical protein